MNFFNPFDPYGFMYQDDDRRHDSMSDEERIRLFFYQVGATVLAIIVGLALCALLSGCVSPKTVEHHHHYREADTLAVKAAVDAHMERWCERIDSSWHEQIEAFSTELYAGTHETEVTTETVTTATDSLGRQIRTEQRTIARDITSEQRQMEQRLSHAYESRLRSVVDSIGFVWQQRFDSVQARSEQSDSSAVVKEPTSDDNRPWYRRWWSAIQYIAIGIVITLAIYFLRLLWRR